MRPCKLKANCFEILTFLFIILSIGASWHLFTQTPRRIGARLQPAVGKYCNLHKLQVLNEEMVEESIPTKSSVNISSQSIGFNKLSNAEKGKELLVYLPGIDGLGISASPHFENLSSAFEFWSVKISGSDRTEFMDYVDLVINFLESHKPGILAAESTGAVVALGVAAKRPDLTKGLVLVNPGTSLPRTQWPILAPLITGAPDDTAKAFGALAFVLTTTDPALFNVVREELEHRDKPPAERPAALLSTLSGYWQAYRKLTAEITPATVQWRVSRWLEQGSKTVEPMLKDIKAPVLAIAGADDRLIPSSEEVRRLQKEIPNCKIQLIRGAGHALLYEPTRFNLTSAILRSSIVKTEKKPCPVESWKYPSSQQIQDGLKSLSFFERAFSPVFYSTGPSGNTVYGLDGVPDGTDSKPLLFVGNHQLLALDLGLFIAEFVKKKDYIPRGLAFPGVFMENPSREDGATSNSRQREQQGAGFLSGNSLQTWGAVPVTPRNFYKLLLRGEPVLLYPGGVREAYHGRGEAYQLFWPEKSEFVKMAALFNATIIPFGGIGCADTAEVILGAEDIVNAPFIGQRAAAFSESMSAAMPMFREDDRFVAPLVRPKLPSRMYFKFGKPISTEALNPKDADGCQDFYIKTKNEVQNCIDYLLDAREMDPYKDAPKRLLYERLMGKQAPSFPININFQGNRSK